MNQCTNEKYLNDGNEYHFGIIMRIIKVNEHNCKIITIIIALITTATINIMNFNCLFYGYC